MTRVTTSEAKSRGQEVEEQEDEETRTSDDGLDWRESDGRTDLSFYRS